jgi:aspartate kinase
MATSEYCVAFTVDGKVDVHALKHQLDELGDVTVAQAKASLCLVGKGLRGRAGVADRIFKPLSDIKIYMVSYGASDLNLTMLIDEENVPRALNRLHKEFFDSATLSDTFENIAQ